jgi:hypothetical protein
MSAYRLFVSEDRMMMVHLWPAENLLLSDEDTVEVATREHPDAIWGPPKILKEEK